jgi:hypothetical protein
VSAEHLSYLYDALAQPRGIVVKTSSPERLRQKLYDLRKTHAPVFEDLTFLVSPSNPDDQLWIIKKHQPRGNTDDLPHEPLDI